MGGGSAALPASARALIARLGLWTGLIARRMTALIAAVTSVLIVGLLAGLVACAGTDDPLRGRFMAFGTEIEVRLRSSDRGEGHAALRDLGVLFQRLHVDWHPWQEGALNDLNQALARGDEAQPGPELIAMIRRAQDFERRSQGQFNAAIGGLVRLWGFHTSNYPIEAPPPATELIDRWLKHSPSAMDIEVRGPTVVSRNAWAQLDFSGMAKGVAARMACDLLVNRGLGDALVNLGGDVMICAQGRRPWSIAISDGRDGIAEVVQLEGPLAVFSSGTAQRWGEWAGKRYAHLLDPGTGRALGHSIQATVIDRDPLLADAAATALAVAGPERWQSTAQTLGVDEAIIFGASGLIGRLDRSQGRTQP